MEPSVWTYLYWVKDDITVINFWEIEIPCTIQVKDNVTLSPACWGGGGPDSENKFEVHMFTVPLWYVFVIFIFTVPLWHIFVIFQKHVWNWLWCFTIRSWSYIPYSFTKFIQQYELPRLGVYYQRGRSNGGSATSQVVHGKIKLKVGSTKWTWAVCNNFHNHFPLYIALLLMSEDYSMYLFIFYKDTIFNVP